MRAVARTFFIRKARRRINLMLCITVRHLTAAEHGRRRISSAPRRVRNPATLRITTTSLSRQFKEELGASSSKNGLSIAKMQFSVQTGSTGFLLWRECKLHFQFPWRAIPGLQEWLDVILFYRPVRLVPIEPGFMPHRKVSQDAGRRRPHAGLDVARGFGARLDAFDEVLPVRNVQIAHLFIVLVCLRLDIRSSIGNQPAAAAVDDKRGFRSVNRSRRALA